MGRLFCVFCITADENLWVGSFTLLYHSLAPIYKNELKIYKSFIHSYSQHYVEYRYLNIGSRKDDTSITNIWPQSDSTLMEFIS